MPHLRLAYPTYIWCLCLNFAEIFGTRKLEFMVIARRYLRDHMVSRFSITATCEVVSDGRTDTRRQLTTTANIRAS